MRVTNSDVAGGDGLILALPSANHDSEVFSDPDRLDLTRAEAGQLSFGHGIHQCPGQQLARAELRVALSRLFDCFPNLQLAITLDELEFEKAFVHRLKRLPVTW
jgi:cytochrome P450